MPHGGKPPESLQQGPRQSGASHADGAAMLLIGLKATLQGSLPVLGGCSQRAGRLGYSASLLQRSHAWVDRLFFCDLLNLAAEF